MEGLTSRRRAGGGATVSATSAARTPHRWEKDMPAAQLGPPHDLAQRLVRLERMVVALDYIGQRQS